MGKEIAVAANLRGRTRVQIAYSTGRETGRLEQQRNHIEAERTKGLIRERLPSAGLRIADVGGGTGYYAAWLESLGHDVVLVDVVERHAREARSGGIPALVADATALPLPDASADAILLLGPLYHLVDASDRVRALVEAHRVLRPGAVLFAAALSRWAKPAARTATRQADGPEAARHLTAILTQGYDAAGGDWHACTYHHRPAELAAEVQAAGFGTPDIFGIEGPLGALARQDPGLTEAAVRLAAEAEREAPALSIHLLAFGRKPADT